MGDDYGCCEFVDFVFDVIVWFCVFLFVWGCVKFGDNGLYLLWDYIVCVDSGCGVGVFVVFFIDCDDFVGFDWMLRFISIDKKKGF